MIDRDDWTLPELDSEELAHISAQLRSLAVPVEVLVEDPENVRLHPDRNMAAVMGSLRKYGQRKPIVVNRIGGVVEAGNGTLSAAIALGWKWIATVLVEDDPSVALGFSIADNRTAELATWDYPSLARGLEALVKSGESAEELGFSEGEYGALLDELVRGGDEAGDEAGDGGDKALFKVKDVRPDEKAAVLKALNDSLADYNYLKAEAY